MVFSIFAIKKKICLKPSGQSGFTFIEMLMVLAILALVTALAVPKLGDSTARREMDSASRQLAADLRWMQQLTINSGGEAIPRMVFASAEPYQYSVMVSGHSVKSVRLPASVFVVNAVVSFNVNGLPVLPHGMGTTIKLNSRKITGLSKQVIIDSVGRIRIE
ncbi:pilus assembly FimT family protein [Sporomusa sphaeroides]|uniref:Prepilin-type N-terminal cleavage/methylation domain-containing protein n=1 Tax=Sporomusa sphaeroides DSM 2875 TaxID=1337886 RepID=A0ABM9VYZ5_9FIRM|nr:prepilin-type N-terminal cleavage/methylation domain-containing protein [Sporomusa sphaeroides]OLS58008.1 hypothetical protein SPSPH_15430 [Sporomusa sphaeroides DSM 2875]CVK17805.1 hypothetical protein SSPH_00440 [Sporomusa sphaeroides DSM 2875]